MIEGHPLEPELEDDIREAWRRTIFDRFLLEDIHTRILRHLVDEDIIGSKVEAVVAALDARAQADSRDGRGRARQVSRRIGALHRQRARSTPIASTRSIATPASTSTAGSSRSSSPRRSRRFYRSRGLPAVDGQGRRAAS